MAGEEDLTDIVSDQLLLGLGSLIGTSLFKSVKLPFSSPKVSPTDCGVFKLNHDCPLFITVGDGWLEKVQVLPREVSK